MFLFLALLTVIIIPTCVQNRLKCVCVIFELSFAIILVKFRKLLLEISCELKFLMSLFSAFLNVYSVLALIQFWRWIQFHCEFFQEYNALQPWFFKRNKNKKLIFSSKCRIFIYEARYLDVFAKLTKIVDSKSRKQQRYAYASAGLTNWLAPRQIWFMVGVLTKIQNEKMVLSSRKRPWVKNSGASLVSARIRDWLCPLCISAATIFYIFSFGILSIEANKWLKWIKLCRCVIWHWERQHSELK